MKHNVEEARKTMHELLNEFEILKLQLICSFIIWRHVLELNNTMQ